MFLFCSKRVSLIASSVWRGTQAKATYRCVILQDANICAPGRRYFTLPLTVSACGISCCCFFVFFLFFFFAFPSRYPLVGAAEARRTHTALVAAAAAPRRRWRSVCGGVRGWVAYWWRKKKEAGVLQEMRLSLRCKYVRQVFSLEGIKKKERKNVGFKTPKRTSLRLRLSHVPKAHGSLPGWVQFNKTAPSCS